MQNAKEISESNGPILRGSAVGRFAKIEPLKIGVSLGFGNLAFGISVPIILAFGIFGTA
jgi:hypothetical protein